MHENLTKRKLIIHVIIKLLYSLIISDKLKMSAYNLIYYFFSCRSCNQVISSDNREGCRRADRTLL